MLTNLPVPYGLCVSVSVTQLHIYLSWVDFNHFISTTLHLTFNQEKAYWDIFSIVQLQTSRRFVSSSTLKVIGFSFYGNPNSTKSKERKYFQGIEDNLALLPKHYPGWTIRNAGTFIDIDIANIIFKKRTLLTFKKQFIDGKRTDVEGILRPRGL